MASRANMMNLMQTLREFNNVTSRMPTPRPNHRMELGNFPLSGYKNRPKPKTYSPKRISVTTLPEKSTYVPVSVPILYSSDNRLSNYR